jgi:hypothetical protein
LRRELLFELGDALSEVLDTPTFVGQFVSGIGRGRR